MSWSLAIERKYRRRAYERAYYAERAKGHRRAYYEAVKGSPAFLAKKRAQAQARYWRNPDKFRAAARERMRALHQARKVASGRANQPPRLGISLPSPSGRT